MYMTNHLKRYGSMITIRLNKKEKALLKKNAYRKNINMSEYLRALILIDNRMIDFQSNIAKANKNLDDITRYEYFIGRHHE